MTDIHTATAGLVGLVLLVAWLSIMVPLAYSIGVNLCAMVERRP